MALDFSDLISGSPQSGATPMAGTTSPGSLDFSDLTGMAKSNTPGQLSSEEIINKGIVQPEARPMNAQTASGGNWLQRNIVNPVGNLIFGTAPDIIARNIVAPEIKQTQQQIIQEAEGTIKFLGDRIAAEQDPQKKARLQDILARNIEDTNAILGDDIFQMPSFLQNLGAAATVATSLIPSAGLGKAFVGKQIGTKLGLDVAGNLVERGALRAAPGLATRMGEGALVGGLGLGSQELAQTGDLGEAAKSAAIGAVGGGALTLGAIGAGKVLGNIGSRLAEPLNPLVNKTEIGRQVASFFAPLGNVIKSAGEAGQKFLDKINEFGYSKDVLESDAKKALGEFNSTYKILDQSQKDEFFRITSANTRENPALTGRDLYTVPELQAQTTDDAVKQTIAAAEPVTRDISALQKGRGFKDPQTGKVIYAQEPAVFFPTRFEEPTYAPNIQAKVDELLKTERFQKMEPELAQAQARKEVEAGLEHAKNPNVGKARQKLYTSAEEARANGVITDAVDAYQRYIEKEIGTSAQFKTFGEAGKEILKNTEGATPEKLATDYKTVMLGAVKKDLEQQFGADEALRISKIIEGGVDFYLNGGRFSALTKRIKQLNSFKLSASFLKNVSQVFNIAMETDLPSFWKGIKAAYLEQPLSVISGVENVAKGVTEKSGSVISQVFETEGTGRMQKVLDVVLKPLKFTETAMNRVASANAGIHYAQRLADVASELNTPRAVDAVERLQKLIGRKLGPEDLVAHGATQAVQLSEDDLLRAAHTLTRDTQFGYNALDLPYWVNSEIGTVVSQFKSFAYNQLKFVFNQTVGELQAGNPGRATRNMLILATIFPAVGQVYKSMDNIIYGTPTDTDFLSVAGWLDRVSNVGAFGMATDVLKSQDGNAFVTSAVGPTAGTIANTVNLGKSLVGDITDMDIGASLEDLYKFSQKQTGGFGRAVGNVTNQTLGF